MKKINDLCDVFIGVNINRHKLNIKSSSKDLISEYNVLKTCDNNILLNELEKPKLVKYHLEKIDDEKIFVKKGDILLKLIYPIKFIYVNSDFKFLVPSMYCVIRIKEKSKINELTLWSYLNSNYVSKNISKQIQGNANSISIKINDIKNMEFNENIVKNINSKLFYKFHIYNQLQNKKNNILMNIINRK